MTVRRSIAALPLLALTAGIGLGHTAGPKGWQPIHPAPAKKHFFRSSEFEMEGEYLSTFLAAHQALGQIADLPQKKKRIENYRLVGFRRDRQHFYIYIVPKHGPDDIGLIGGETSLGREVKFTIRRSDFKVIRQMYPI